MAQDQIIDGMAAKMAVALNGGDWVTHYTEEQRRLWRWRASRILAGEGWR